MKSVQLMEALVTIGMAYLSYLTAEIFHMSGILAVTFCGITAKNYVEKVLLVISTVQMEREIFLTTELLHNSGILVVISRGIIAKNYVENAWFVMLWVYLSVLPHC